MPNNMKVILLALMLALFAMGTVAAVLTKSDVDVEETVEGMRREGEEGSESWTTWAKDKISEGLGFKDKADEEEAARKAGEGVKSAREKAQDVASGNPNNSS